jgi:hypothetical protein
VTTLRTFYTLTGSTIAMLLLGHFFVPVARMIGGM